MIAVNFNNVTSEMIGETHGLTQQALSDAINKCAPFIKTLLEERQKGGLAFMNLPYQDELVRDIEKFAAARRAGVENFIVLGIGGSALGASAVHTALNTPFYNLLPDKKRKFPKMFFPDNVDPEEIAFLMENCDPKRTIFNVISKSGDTAEILANFQVFLKLLKAKLGKKYRDHLIITTDKGKGFLRKFVNDEKLASFVVPDGVGGRFSVFTPVGMVPLAFAGISNARLLKGAALMDEACKKTDPYQNPGFLTGLVNYLLDAQKGKSIVVFIPYSESLREVADWFCQLWGESLGKKYSVDGREVFCGPTPVKALGATDQHSQLQLYNEGPNNKLIVFIETQKFRANVKIPAALAAFKETHYLSGKSLTELLNKEKLGTEVALTRNRRPNYTIKLDAIAPESVGALLFMLETATAFAGKFYAINPFDQPGVEMGKKATKALMGQKGMESFASDINELLKKHSPKWKVTV